MPKNALVPKTANALAERQSPLDKLLTASAKYPQYQDLTGYLNSRNMMPPMNMAYLGSDTAGEFKRNNFFNQNLPETGVVNFNYGAEPSTVVHELTHAADRQLKDQYLNLKHNKSNLSPEEEQFVAAYQKLSQNTNPMVFGLKRYPKEELANYLSPEWNKKNQRYRASEPELPAWGMASTIDSKDSREYNAPLHLDPTMATEFSILMNMAHRLQKGNK